MRVYVAHVTCQNGPAVNVLVFCEGKEHVAHLAIHALWPRNPCGIQDSYEAEEHLLPSLLQAIRTRKGDPITDLESLAKPGAYILADES